MSLLRVACGSSPEYLPHAAAMMHSVFEHRGDLEVEVHYLHGPALPRADRERLVAFVAGLGGRIALHEVGDDRLRGLPEMRHIPATMWYRTFLVELLADVDRVLYLDADTLAVDDLGELWRTELGDHYVAAVTNLWEPWNEGYPVHGLGLPERDAYFNSGVLLMNLDAMRRDHCIREVLAFARGREALPWGDQDALNVVLGERRLALAPRWNCMNSVLTFPHAVEVFGAEAVRRARERPGIRHFEGPTVNKPWHVLCEGELRDLYRRHRRATPWPAMRPVGLTPVAALRLARRRLATALAR